MASADDSVVERGQTIADRHNSIAMLHAHVQEGHTTAKQAPGMIQDGEDGQVYLCGFASEESFVGCLEDKDSINDGGIEDFIRQNNPDMFRRLFTQPDTLTNFLRLDNDSGCCTLHPLNVGVLPAYQDTEISSSIPIDHELQLVLLQIKRLLVSSLLGGHVLVLQKLMISYAVCGHPFCQFSDASIPRGSFILQLRLEGALEVRHFCLGCVESIFSCQAATAAQQTNLPLAPMVALDGMAEVIEAAENLAAPLPKPNGVLPSPPKRKSLPLQHKAHGSIENYFKSDFLFDHASNSLQAKSLRRRRDAEIDDILANVDKYEKRRQEKSGQAQKSPLMITAPPQVPREERYKKQGLGRWDKERERVVSRRDAGSGDSVISTVSIMTLAVRICKCREPSGVGVVLRCSTAFCPVGLFHLECTGLLQQPEANLIWSCSECSGMPEGSLVAAEVLDEGNDLEMDDEHSDDYDNIHDGDDASSSEDFNSDNGLAWSDRVSPVTARTTASPDDLSDCGSISTFTHVRGASPEQFMNPPSAFHAVHELTPTGQRAEGSPITPRMHFTLTSSFTPVNPHRTLDPITPVGIRHRPFLSLDGGPSAADRQAAICLPVGWSQITFEDLAPFIVAETNVASYRTLSPEHMGMLEKWRAACTISKLLPGQRALNPFHVNTVQTVPLSHLLAMVEAEMAHKCG